MVNINLESIREYFPQLKRFISRIREEEIELIKDERRINVNTNLVMECMSNIWTIVAFGEAINKFDIEISIKSLEEIVEWLGYQNERDTDMLMMRMNIIDDLDRMDTALYQLYEVLDDTLKEVKNGRLYSI